MGGRGVGGGLRTWSVGKRRQNGHVITVNAVRKGHSEGAWDIREEGVDRYPHGNPGTAQQLCEKT